MLKLLKPETRGNIRENTEEEVEEETRSFYTPTKSVRISSTQKDPNICRNTMNVGGTCPTTLTVGLRMTRVYLLLQAWFFKGQSAISNKPPLWKPALYCCCW